MGDSATILLRGDNKPLKGALSESESMFKRFGGRVTSIVAGLGVGAAISKAFSIGKGLFADAAEAERGMKLFENAVLQTDNAAQITSDDMAKLASEIQNTSRFADDAAISGGKMLLAFGNIKGDIFKDVVKSAADMAAFTGGELEPAIESLGRALADPERGMMRLRREGVILTDEQQKLVKGFMKLGDTAKAQGVILEAVNSKFGGSAAADLSSWPGKLDQLTNKFGDAGEAIVAAFVPAMEALFPLFDRATAFLEDHSATIGEIVKDYVDFATLMAGWWMDKFHAAQKGVVWAMTAGMTAIQQWKELFGIAVDFVLLKATENVEDLKHFYGTVVPEYLRWFADNWKNIFRDILAFQETVATNLFENFKSLMTGIWDLLNGKGFSFEWTPLTEGFKAATEELPKIAARQATETEAALKMRIGNAVMGLGEAFNENLKFNMAAAFPDEKREEIKQDVEEVKREISDTDKQAALKAAEKDKKDKKDKKDEKEDDKGVAASFEELTALSRRIQQSAASSPEERAARAAKEAGDKMAKAVGQASADQINALKKMPKELAQEILNAGFAGTATFG